ncbi:MAG: hypothetical protein Q7U56_01755, partial [Humidesulfovibrio sp.]|nr:hypothetical protein [Humidesulfovibrio sp.]
VLRHPDVPGLGPAEVAAFTRELARSKRVLVSGCRVEEDVHPYRLFRQAEDGRLDYLLDVPQDIRGARQRYPELLRFVPALVGLPEGLPLGALDQPEDFALFELPRSSLLDAGDPVERLELLVNPHTSMLRLR